MHRRTSTTAQASFGNRSNYQGGAGGTLTITGQPLAVWQTQNFTPAQITAGDAADAADPDHDGLENLAEYALGTDPNHATPPLTGSLGPSGFSITFTRPKGLPDVSYAAESSADLGSWAPVSLVIIADGPVQAVRATDPLNLGDPARRFLRLKFTR